MTNKDLNNHKPKEVKDCMFQFALGNKPFLAKNCIIEDTGLITKAEAEELWNKYKHDFIKYLENGNDPQMGIWIDCVDSSHYGKLDPDFDADYRDCVIEHGSVYRVTKKRII